MHVTLHLTTGCNMACDYCYSPPKQRHDMSGETAFAAIDFIAKNYPVNTGVIFFGGEPLLKKDLIASIIEHAKKSCSQNNAYFHYKISTNGILLDEDFLRLAGSNGIQVALSIDGNKSAHDTFRRFPGGQGTFDIVNEKASLLLKYQPYAKALMTISPENLEYYADSFQYLIEKGFKYIITSLNYAGNWQDSDMKRLEQQYKKIAQLYEKFTLEEKKFYYSTFEMKLAGHIRQMNAECYQCHLAKRQISIAHDGRIYPCVQFVKDGISNTAYSIGDINSGINFGMRDSLYKKSKEQEETCLSCAYNSRCNNKCSCLNWQLTGDISSISPVICESERILIPIVDKLGDRLYKKKAPMFIQKHYNAVYPILSMMEDMIG